MHGKPKAAARALAAGTLVLSAACADDTLLSAPRSGLRYDTSAAATTRCTSPSATKFAVSCTAATVVVGDTLRFALNQGSATWRVADTTIARVDASGLLRGLRAGTTSLTATRKGGQATTSTAQLTVAAAAPVVAPAPAPTPPPAITPPPDTTIAVPITPAAAGVAELPRATVDTRMPTPTGRTWTVAAGGDLQGALNSAQPGDQIVLAAGATFVGNFELPAKANAAGQWITVRTGGTLPAEGTRVGPGDAAQMPKLLTPNAMPALATQPGAQGWRLVGLEVGVAPGSTWAYSLVNFGDGNAAAQTSLAQIPGRLVLDRSYVHGSPTFDLRRCVALNSASSAVVDSYLAECHSNQADSQGIAGWNGPGPYKIENNHVEAGHEVVFFGGQTPGITGLMPSDITVRRNHLTRPLAWRGVWKVKNLFELKTAKRVLVEANVLENNWIDAQAGFAVLLQTLNDENNAAWIEITDVTIRNNVIRSTAQGINLLSRVSYGGPLPTTPMSRVEIRNNVVVTDAAISGPGRMVQLLSDLRDVTVAQNTFVDARGALSNSALMFDDGGNLGPAQRLQVVNNAFGPPQWSPVLGNGTVGALTTLAKFAPDAVMSGNVFTAGNSAQFPAGNYFPGTLTEAGLAGATAGSYQLTASYASNPGADAAAVAAATQGVVR